jgi:hypothetical protein
MSISAPCIGSVDMTRLLLRAAPFEARDMHPDS